MEFFSTPLSELDFLRIQEANPCENIRINYSSQLNVDDLKKVLKGKRSLSLHHFAVEIIELLLDDLLDLTRLDLSFNNLTDLPKIPCWNGLKDLDLSFNDFSQEVVDSWVFPPDLECFLMVPNNNIDYSKMIGNLLTNCPKLEDLGIHYGSWCSDELYDRIIEKICNTKNFKLRFWCTSNLSQDRLERLVHPNLISFEITDIYSRVDILPFLDKSTHTDVYVTGLQSNITFEKRKEYFVKSGFYVGGNDEFPDELTLILWQRVKTVEYKVMIAMLSSYGRVGIRSGVLRHLPTELYRLLLGFLLN